MTSYLLDTCALVWMLLDDPRLGKNALAVIKDESTKIYVSSISIVEMAIKAKLGKWPEVEGMLPEMETVFEDAKLTELALTVEHAVLLATLPDKHKDPFDRILAAQARAEGLTLITSDKWMKQFGVKILW